MRNTLGKLLLGATLLYSGFALANPTPTPAPTAPTFKVAGRVGLEVCLPGKKDCLPCTPGATYDVTTITGERVNVYCPSQKPAKKGVPSCASQYSGNGACLNDSLARAFNLSDGARNGSCAGKNTACYDASKAQSFATLADVLAAEERITAAEERVNAVEGQAGDNNKRLDDLTPRVAGVERKTAELDERVGEIERIPVDGNYLLLSLSTGYIFNGGHGGELGFGIGSTLFGGDAYLGFIGRAFLLKDVDTSRYDVVLPTATQSTVDTNSVRRYAAAGVQARWNLNPYFQPSLELGAEFQRQTNDRALTLLGETREMERVQNEYVGFGAIGAEGHLFGPVKAYLRLEGNTKVEGAVATGLKVDF